MSMNVYRDVAASPDCSIQSQDSERRPPLLLLLRTMPGGRSHSHDSFTLWKEKIQLLGLNVAGQESRNSTLSCCLPNFVLA